MILSSNFPRYFCLFSDAVQQHGGKSKAPKTFAFDHCFWSMDESNPKFASKSLIIILQESLARVVCYIPGVGRGGTPRRNL